MAYVNFNFESECREDKYRSILFETYALEILDLIFSQTNVGFCEQISLGLVHGQCIGCQFDCRSQNDHDICLLPFDEQIEYFFDFAIVLIEGK